MSIPSPDPHRLDNNKYVQILFFGFAGLIVGSFSALALSLADRGLFICAFVGAAAGIAIGYRIVRKWHQ